MGCFSGLARLHFHHPLTKSSTEPPKQEKKIKKSSHHKTKNSRVQNNSLTVCVSPGPSVWLLNLHQCHGDDEEMASSIRVCCNTTVYMTPQTASHGRGTLAAKNQNPPVPKSLYISLFGSICMFNLDAYHLTVVFPRRGGEGRQDVGTLHVR